MKLTNIQAACAIQKHARNMLTIHSTGRNPMRRFNGLCYEFNRELSAIAHADCAEITYGPFNLMLGTGLYAKGLGPGGTFTEQRRIFCQYLADCSLETLRKHIGKGRKTYAQGNAEGFKPLLAKLNAA